MSSGRIAVYAIIYLITLKHHKMNVERLTSFWTSLTIIFIIGYALNYFLKSDRLTKWLSYKNYLYILGICFIGNTIGYLQAKTAYNNDQDEYWATVRHKVDSIGTEMGFTGSDLKKYSGCVLGKYSTAYPNGFKGVPEKEVFNFSKNASQECSKGLTFRWTPLFEKSIKRKILLELDSVNVPIEKKESLIDCTISKMKEKYPNGINKQIPPEELDAMQLDCINTIWNVK